MQLHLEKKNSVSFPCFFMETTPTTILIRKATGHGGHLKDVCFMDWSEDVRFQLGLGADETPLSLVAWF